MTTSHQHSLPNTPNIPKLASKAMVKYYANYQQFNHFFTDKLCACVNRMAEKLDPSSQISVYPDATLKTNKLPTGVACISEPSETILLPQLLRDPGCGFLTFKIEFTTQPNSNWQQEAGQLLEKLVNDETVSKESYTLSNEKLREALEQGLYALNLSNTEMLPFINRMFPVDSYLFNTTDAEIEAMQTEFLAITNTVEIRKPYKLIQTEILENNQIDENCFIGFIHTGSHVFPRILTERFFYNIAEYSDLNHLFTIEEINDGLFGVHYETALGREFYAWINAAMNYALVSRYYAYKRIKDALENTFDCKLTIISDNVHAGVFEKNNKIYSVRGVQSLTNPHTETPIISLLAGQRETIAALVVAGTHSAKHHDFYAHGTGNHILENYNYENNFSKEEAHNYMHFAKNTFYNSEPDYASCLAYTSHLLSSLEYFNQINLAKPIALLSPFINIQSEWLKS